MFDIKKMLFVFSAIAAITLAFAAAAFADNTVGVTNLSYTDRGNGVLDVSVTYSAPEPVSQITMVASTEPVTEDILKEENTGKIIGLCQVSNGTELTFAIKKPAKSETIYVLLGGTDVSTPSSGNFDYIAMYKITFYDEDGTTVLQQIEVAEGTVPQYTGETPTKAEDDSYTYRFIGWTVEPAPATSDASYIVKYKAVPKVTKIMYGDVDGNGKVTSTDAVWVLRAAAKMLSLTDEQKIVADVDGSGKVTSTDAVLILRKAAKMISKFPVEE